MIRMKFSSQKRENENGFRVFNFIFKFQKLNLKIATS